MLDGLYKSAADRFWDRVAAPVARTGVSPNQLTLACAALVLASAAAYVGHRTAWLLGVSVGAFELLDNLDGALARVTSRSTRLGAYLDAVTDRYKESAVFAAIGFVHDAWPLAFACITGSLLTSYAKARAGMEVAIDNAAWPDLFERLERLLVLCGGLIASALWPRVLGVDSVVAALVIVAVMSHVSALQRLWRAWRVLQHAERSR